jgi:hypothetical protein
LRTIIWPYLLRLVDWGEEFDERLLTEIKQAYEQEILEWSLVEEKMNAIRDIKGIF